MNERDKELAEQAGLLGPSSRVDNAHESAEKFADLIRADERESCAKVIDKHLKNWASLAGKDKAYKWLEKIAVTIRARGNT
jgi:hypothetical protein